MESNWSARRKLGEAGFIQQGQEVHHLDKDGKTTVISHWMRNRDIVALEENDLSPKLFNKNGDELNFNRLGVINEETQGDHSPSTKPVTREQ